MDSPALEVLKGTSLNHGIESAKRNAGSPYMRTNTKMKKNTNTVARIGIDTSKSSFQLHAVDRGGKVVFRRTLSRAALLSFMAQQPSCEVGMEACSGSHYWGREFIKLGHDVKLIAPQFVKPFVQGNKTDAADAAAIVEAMSRPHMRFVPIKSAEQQQVLMIHTTRQRLVKNRTMTINSLRGLLGEYGFVFSKGRSGLRGRIQELLMDSSVHWQGIPPLARQLFASLLGEWFDLDARIKDLETILKEYAASNDACQRLRTIPGIGLIIATAMVGHVGNAQHFKSGRHLASWLGLVTKQHSTGGKERLLGISKRGDTYLRSLIVHGARATMSAAERFTKNTTSPVMNWAKAVKERRGYNRAVVALANKTARIIWALLRNPEARYDATYTPERFRRLASVQLA